MSAITHMLTPAEVRARVAPKPRIQIAEAQVRPQCPVVAEARRKVATWLPAAMEHPHADDPVVSKLLKQLCSVMALTNENPTDLVRKLAPYGLVP